MFVNVSAYIIVEVRVKTSVYGFIGMNDCGY